jgi:hypothetical protein
MENFKKVQGSNYSISDKGNLRNDDTNYVLKPMKNHRTGYYHYQFKINDTLVWRYVHRLVYETFNDKKLRVSSCLQLECHSY